MKKLCLLAALALAVASPRAQSQVQVIAHRGEHLHNPENTLAAIRGAIAAGADYVELDVRTTRDGHLVLMHDDTLDRTTDGHGKVARFSLAQISQLKVKPVGNTDPADLRVPTFEQALQLAHGHIHVYVDCKDLTPASLATALKQTHMTTSVVVYGDDPFLADVHRLAPALRVMPEADDPATLDRLAASLDLKILAFDADDFNDPTILAARHKHLDIFVDRLDAFDSEVYWAKAIESGATGIQTNHPADLIAYLARRHLHTAGAVNDNLSISLDGRGSLCAWCSHTNSSIMILESWN
jgi:glycerophosphoryl diester phosphodiesterase